MADAYNATDDLSESPDNEGAIDTSVDTGEDKTTSKVSNALQAVEDALMFGRQSIQGQGQSHPTFRPTKQTYKDDIIPSERGGATDFSPHSHMDWMQGAGSNPDVSQGHVETTDDVMQKRDSFTDRSAQFRDTPKGANTPAVSPGQRSLRNVMMQTQATSGYAAGGAINAEGLPEDDTEDQTSSDTSPGTDDSEGDGALPVNQPAAPDQQATPEQPAKQSTFAPGSISDRIQKYLRGEGAASAAQVERFRAAADPSGQLPVNERNLAAVEAAMTKAGPKAAFGVMQYYRKNWDHEQNLARAALTGANGKSPDPEAVVAHANAAYPNMPDGTNITFSQSETGYRAEIEFGKGKKFQNVDLTPEQMHQWLDIGKSGQFDGVYENSGPNILMQIARGKGTPLPARKAPGKTLEQEGNEIRAAQASAPNPALAKPRTAMDEFDPADVRIAKERFPSIGDRSAMLDWLQERRGTREEQKNKADVAKEKGDVSTERARIYSGSRERIAAGAQQNYSERTNALITNAHSADGRAALSGAIRAANTKMMTGEKLSQDDQDVLTFARQMGMSTGQTSTTNRQSQSQPQPQQQTEEQNPAPQAAPGSTSPTAAAATPRPTAPRPPTGANAAGNPNLGPTRIVVDPKTGKKYRVQ